MPINDGEVMTMAQQVQQPGGGRQESSTWRSSAAGKAALWLAALLPSVSPAIEAQLQHSVLVAGSAVTLGDVAQLQGAQPAELQRLSALALGGSPRAGFPRRITRQDIERALRPAAPGVQVDWTGADAVVVEAASVTVAGSTIADEAALYLYRLLNADHQRVAIRPVEPPADVLVASGKVTLRPRPLPYSEALRRQARVWVDILVNGSFYRSVTVSFAVEVWRQAWTVREDMLKGQALNCASLERRDARIEGEVPFDGDCNAATLRLRKAMRQGEVLAASAIETMPAVVQGQLVLLRTRVAGVEVELPATAMSDARLGQPVQLRSPLSQAVLGAQVTAPREATLSIH